MTYGLMGKINISHKSIDVVTFSYPIHKQKSMQQKQISDSISLTPAETHVVQLDERGRLVLPIAIRNKLSLHPKEKLIAHIDGDTLRLATVKSQVSKVQGILAQISPERRLSEELIAERRKETEFE